MNLSTSISVAAVLNHGGGIPGKQYLTGYWKINPDGLQDSIGLSVSDYGLIGSTWQTVFFTNPTTPILHTRTEWVAILLAHPSVNLLNVLCSATGDVLIYRDDTSREILNKALRYLKLPIIVEETPENILWSDTTILPSDGTILMGE